MRTDDNNNPTAVTTYVAAMGLIRGTEWVPGTVFPAPSPLVTAKLLGDPVALSIKLISTVGYYTHSGQPRWNYIALPKFVWDTLTPSQQRDVIGFHYKMEGGVTMRLLFPNTFL